MFLSVLGSSSTSFLLSLFIKCLTYINLKSIAMALISAYDSFQIDAYSFQVFDVCIARKYL